jgi:ParB/RepB/Spo0J family partition protein
METTSFEMRELPHSEIVEVLDNYRKRANPTKDAELIASIKQHGIIQPVCVRPRATGGYALVFGSRRLRANQMAGNTTILAVIRDMPDSAVRTTQLIENGQREDAHPMEEAEAFSELVTQRGYSVEQIAREVGKSEKHVRLRLKLCSLAEEVRAAFFEEKLTTQAAYLLARIPNHDDQRKALAYVLDSAQRGHPMTVNDIHAYIERTYMLELRDAPFDIKDATLVPEAGPCGACPK